MTDSDLIEQLERVFKTVIDRARTDSAFAKQLSKAVGGGLTTQVAPRKSQGKRAPEITLDYTMSSDAIRETLAVITRDQIYALVKARNLAPNRTSGFNKTQLIEHVVRYFRKQDEQPRKLEY